MVAPNELRHSLLAEDWTWTGRQLAQARAGRGIALGVRQVRRHLKRFRIRYRRTAATLKHQQDPAKPERGSISTSCRRTTPN
jgi:hypothetical protein